MDNANGDPLRARIRQIFSFLHAVVQQRYAAPRRISEQPFRLSLSTLPDHESVLFTPEGNFDTPILEVKRPRLIRCPRPDAELLPWLEKGWDSARVGLQVRNSLPSGKRDDENNEIYEPFDGDFARLRLFDEWSRQRAIWSEERLRAESAQSLFEQLYEQLATMEKEGGTSELVVGDGLLNWRLTSGGVEHPLLIKRVELVYDQAVPSFKILNTDRPVELYNQLLMSVEEVDMRQVQRRTEDLERNQYHPLSAETKPFLKALIQSISPADGYFFEVRQQDGERTSARMWREPYLFTRKRTMAFAQSIEKILKDLETRDGFPQSLAAIAGLHYEGTRSPHKNEWLEELSLRSQRDPDDIEIFLAKEANADQISIIKRLSQSGRVHVQGPPGTGKTHTIGNIIGHLLSQGKRILVTSHTEKALKVLKEKVPEDLRSLCVPVLAGDTASKRQLENSINDINLRLTRDDPDRLLARARVRFSERAALMQQIKELKGRLRAILDSEYLPLMLDNAIIDPSSAAREVVRTSIGNDWMPGDCVLNDPLPLTATELNALYETNLIISPLEEHYLDKGIPSIASVLEPDKFEYLVKEYRDLLSKDLTSEQQFWIDTGGSFEALERTTTELFKEFSEEILSLTWRPAAIAAGKQGQQFSHLWEVLCDRIATALKSSQRLAVLAYLEPEISASLDLDMTLGHLEHMNFHLREGGKLGTITLMMHADWKETLKQVFVSAGQPNRREHFEALIAKAYVLKNRHQIKHLWDDLVGRGGGTSFRELGESPESSCFAIVPEIKRSLTWYESVWNPLLRDLKAQGLRWEKVEGRVPRKETSLADYVQIQDLVTEPRHLPAILSAELNRRRMAWVEAQFDAVQCCFASAGIGAEFLSAVQKRDCEAYAECHSRLIRLIKLQDAHRRRHALLLKLASRNATWADAILGRRKPHDGGVLPGDSGAAWRWKRLACELDRRKSDSAGSLQEQLELAQKALIATTSDLISSLAWGKQVSLIRTKPQLQQALTGWLGLQKKRDATANVAIKSKLAVAAQAALTACTEAVPVWIMPLQAVAENLDPSKEQFDVVIIDEASQANLMALIPLYMAKEAIIVGDHEQTTPEAVGIQQMPIQNLIDVHLKGIPNCELFDLLTSVYDLAMMSFGNTLMLTEHFRCVPDIIGFSNKLSYDNKIKPLREQSSTVLRPSTIAYRVKGSSAQKKNEVEADTIAKLMRAMTEHDLYDGKTIGVMTMLGEDQGKLIDAKVRAIIGADEYMKRRIVCGTPPQFQGDERDVIFLSLVDGIGDDAATDVLARKGDGAYGGIKKRFNVASSRARDQLWVVHSMDPDVHLKPGDIRRELISFARNPRAYLGVPQQEVAKAESLFEKLVMERLVREGYQVLGQWEVGYYRLDMVVVGNGKRLAIECDGDRWHGPDKRDSDLERQSVLERLGWKFARIRGSIFFRDPVSAMVPVLEKLEALGIERLGQLDVIPAQTDDMTIIRELEALAFPESADGTLAEIVELSELPISFEPAPAEFAEYALASDGGGLHRKTNGQAVKSHSYVPKTGSDEEAMMAILLNSGEELTRDQLIKHTIYAKGYRRSGRLLLNQYSRVFATLKRKGALYLNEADLVVAAEHPKLFN
jgi:very-short-patch-repair endonuclease/cellulose biosynthesis protein BcsQ